jgi:NAD(P)-dependent dehydrogenase (short-subunit alcohol dehydrogenase family)
MARQALVLGGSGTVGRAVVRALTDAGVPTVFTHHTSREPSLTLARELDQRTEQVDLRDRTAIATLFARLEAEDRVPDVLIHCAGQLCTTPLVELSDDAFEESYAIGARSAFAACREMARLAHRRPDAEHGRDIVLVGALDRGQSLPIPVAFAACQGMLPAMAMAIAKELGPLGVRINVIALGLLDAGLSLRLATPTRDAYLAYSALRRFGSAEEAARAIVWLALENTYLSGKVAAINGGL